MDRIIDKPIRYGHLAEAIAEFPYQAKEDGSCEMLEDNRCKVYDNRPLLCDVGRIAEETKMPVSREKWFEMNYKACKSLQLEMI